MHAPLAPQIRVEWHRLATLEAIAGEWKDLAARALERNVFLEPSFALAAAPVFGRDAKALLVRSAAGRLIGMFAMQTRDWRRGQVPALLTGYIHPFAPLGTPLVDGEQAAAAIGAWLDHLLHDGDLPRVAMLPLIPQDGPFAASLDDALQRRGLRSAHLGAHRRAMLIPGPDREHYIEQALGSQTRRRLARTRRRLAERGELTTTPMAGPETVAALTRTLLDIEARGWKGRAGTAIAADPQVRNFVESALDRLACEGQVHGEVMSLAGEPIAAIIMLRSGPDLWGWKIAYDERFAHYSPGVQLMIDATRKLLADPSVASLDSCATPDHPMIDHLWRERLALSDRLISLRPGFSPAFLLAKTEETARRRAIAIAKKIYQRFGRCLRRSGVTPDRAASAG